MNFYELIFTIFILYLLYKFVYNILLPVTKATTTVRDHMRQQMQEEQMRNQPQQKNTAAAAASRNSSTTTDGEYIDFEEVT